MKGPRWCARIASQATPRSRDDARNAEGLFT